MAQIVTLVLTFGITVFVLLRSRRVYAKPAPQRQRISKIMFFGGILLLVAGLLMAIVMLGTPDEGWTPQSEYYENVAKHFGKASACIQCGQCEGVCPQHLPIIEYLQTVAKHFERE